MRTAKLPAVICLVALLVSVSVAEGAEHGHKSRAKHKAEHCYRTKHHKRVCRPLHKRKSTKAASPVVLKPTASTIVAPTPASTPATTPAPAPAPSPPACPTNEPLPTPVAGLTTIVGYATLAGGPAPEANSCPFPHESEGGTVILETAGGQVLESQSLAPGQPFDFNVQPGEYQVLNSVCMEGALVTALAGEQTKTPLLACNIP